MIKINAFACFLFLSSHIFGQQDSALNALKQKLKTSKSPKEKVQLKFDIGDQEHTFRVSFWDSLSKEAHQLKMSRIEATSLNNMGFICNAQGNIQKALNCFQKSLRIQEKIGDEEGLSSSLNNIGYIYETSGDLQQALNYYLKCLKIRKNNNNQEGIALTSNNIGSIYVDLKQFDKAWKYYEQSLRIRKESNDESGMAITLNNMGVICQLTGKHKESLNYNFQSLEIRERLKDQEGIALSLNNIGGTYLHLNDFKAAENYCEKAYLLAKKNAYPAIISDISENLYEIYKKTGKNKQALEMFELYTRMKDSISNDDIKKALVENEIQYKYEKKQALQKVEQEKKNAVFNEKIKQQKTLNISFTIGMCLIVFISVFIYRSLRIARKQKKVIEDQKQLVEEKNKEITDSITYAKRIQSAILPQPKLVKSYLKESFILYKPKDIVAGDFYWFEVIDDLIFFAAADCTGHGVPGALVSVVCHNALNRSVKEFNLKSPGEILDKTREIVIAEFEKSDEDVKDGMDISLCVLDLKNNILNWSGAHNPLWILRKGELIEYKADKQPIGKFAHTSPFNSMQINLLQQDEIYIFTDGFQDQFGGEKGKKFKVSQLRSLIMELHPQTMTEKCKQIDLSFESWRGDLEQVDDVCMIGVRL